MSPVRLAPTTRERLRLGDRQQLLYLRFSCRRLDGDVVLRCGLAWAPAVSVRGADRPEVPRLPCVGEPVKPCGLTRSGVGRSQRMVCALAEGDVTGPFHR